MFAIAVDHIYALVQRVHRSIEERINVLWIQQNKIF